MNRAEQVDRYHQAQKSHDWRYQWWSRADALEMVAGLTAALQAAGPGARLVVQRGLDRDGDEVLWHCVEDNDVYGEGFNKSHPCPPFCG